MQDDRAASTSVDVSIPRTAAELDIPLSLVHDLVLRQILVDGRTSTMQLSKKLCISPMLMTTIVEELRDLRYLEVQGLEGRDYLLAATDAGRAQGTDRMKLCRYVGPAPVSLAKYKAIIAKQTASPRFNLPALKEAFSDLVISDELLKEIGPAAIAGGAMFLYGPPGTGKSSIAERLLRVYGDYVLVPYTVEVDGQIISVFDPVVHRPLEDQPSDIDPRWIVCRRPFIIVGGELQREMLDLAYQSGSGIYLAPVQMQANNGVLVIDDFGRQTLTPQELLNRWIVPLDRSVDYLSLDYGLKFEIPFDCKIVFSTNLQPETLGDEAFFRRIQSKILIPTITDSQFDEVLRRVALQYEVELTPDASTHLRWMSRELGDGDLRPYLPGAVCKILLSICTFEDIPPTLDPRMIERIAHMYFTHADDKDDEDAPVATRAVRSGRRIRPSSSFETTAGTDAPPAVSMFAAKPGPGNDPSRVAERDWTSVAAKAMAAMKAEADDDQDGSTETDAAGAAPRDQPSDDIGPADPEPTDANAPTHA